MPLRIAYVINSLEGGGAALPVPAVTSLLRARGAEVRLLALSMRNGKARPAITAADLDHRVGPGGKSDNLRQFAWLVGELRQFRPDLIWTSLTQATVLGQLAGRLLSVPVVSWQHNAFLKPANLRLLRRTKGWSRLWIADSAAVADLTRQRLGVASDRLATWPLFTATAPDAEGDAHHPVTPFRIGSLGRLHPNKGYDVLINALAIIERAPDHRQFVVEIAGEGDEHARLEAMREAAGVQSLRLIGYRTDNQAFLRSCHGYVQPSRAEGFCIAAHEAMASGLPAVVGDVGEMPYTVRASAGGLVVPPDDAQALAAALRHLIDDEDRAHAMGLAAQRYVLATFSPQAFQAAGNAIYDRIEQLFAAST